MKSLSAQFGLFLVLVVAALSFSSRGNVNAVAVPTGVHFAQAGQTNSTMLISPKNGLTTDDPHQLFVWQPQTPSQRGTLTYQLKLAEILPQQTPEVAARFNQPHLLKDGLERSSYEISAADAPLLEGRAYAWQVKAFVDGRLQRESEILMFRHAASDPSQSNKAQPQEPAQCASCAGGMFESGNLNAEGWTGATGVWNGSQTQMTNAGFVVGRHTVTNCPSVDPILNGYSVNLPVSFEGLHGFKLGNNLTGAQAEQLRRSFVPTASKPDFTFSYAVVLEDPGHAAADQPYFRYRVYIGADWASGLKIMQFKKAANQNDPYFKSVNNGQLVYKSWDCETINLGAYLNQTVTIEFETADCRWNGHYGYAYLDGFCDTNVTAQLSLPDQVCLSNPIFADGSASTGETDYFVSVEPSDQWWGRPDPTKEVMHWFTAQQAGTIDLKSFYSTYGSAGNDQFKCGTYYRVTLAVKNHCVPWKSVTKLIYVLPCDEPVPSFTMTERACLAQPIVINASATTNETDYFVSIEPSDQWWGRPDPSKEVMHWFSGQAGVVDLKNFYSTYGTIGNNQFQCDPLKPRYYRIKVAVRNGCVGWRETVKLLYIRPCNECLAAPGQ